MGYQKKTGKGRLDKYYHLAKEQGYRARSAFKLIQLNKKYNFLGTARALIDLCAAPGGWLQVAQKYMPVKSLIIGVDLVPIKPIPNVITFAEDILTDKCRNRLRQEMKTWKADVVLHDGAPNVGLNWSHDAYSQSELVLMSLKLATEFLQKGGTFVTKIFRSKDYNSLIWVFNQLFRKVEATKPPSSRNVSAEIFVVCQDYIAPKKIDPRILDAKYVFEDLLLKSAQTSTDIFAPETGKKKRHREGYEDGDVTMHKKIDAIEFIKSKDPAGTLGDANEMVFESEEALDAAKLPETTEDILLSCKDLKLLGKKDFRRLMKWRASLRERFQLEKKEEAPKIEEGADGSDVEGELDALAAEETKRLRKERRRINDKRRRQIVKLQLNMTTSADVAMDDEGGGDLFRASSVEKARGAHVLNDLRQEDVDAVKVGVDGVSDEELVDLGARPMDSDESDSDFDAEQGPIQGDDTGNYGDGDDDASRLRQIEEEMDHMYASYIERQRERDARFDVKRKRQSEGEFAGFSDDEKSNGNASSSDGESDAESASSQDDASDDDEIRSMMRQAKKAKTGKRAQANKSSSQQEDVRLAGRAALWFDQPTFKGAGGVDLANVTDDEESEDAMESEGVNEDESDDDGFEVMSVDDDGDPNDVELKDEERQADYDLATPEAMTMIRDLANRKTTKHDLIDKHFNRYTFNDSAGLPEWFVDDENKNNKPMLPVTKEAVRMLREKLRALDARPIKKVAEARARKKMRVAKRVANMQKKAENVIANEDMTEAEKARNIDRMIKRATKAKPTAKPKLVIARNSNRGLKGRPRGVKGKYKMVDARMKKDLRAQKKREKAKKSSRRK
ncbi:AdoMet-dependent rRNA methyltransferase spb1 [Coemansia sp. Benny D160-2]|nr:AdoMet-dependent rRNA methyltransferase spb1 [Coemansia sp. Benny D160-2]